MFANWQLILVSLGYIGLLFVIAYLGDKYRRHIGQKYQPLIYALTLGVYCTSWSFLGTTSQASENFIAHLPIYIAPILLFVFAWPFIQRIIRISLKLNLTSIADLLAARFGKSNKLAVLVTIVALIGVMPYIALQLKAIVYSFQQLQTDHQVVSWRFGLIVSLFLAGFTIIFGVRNIGVTERHPGVMLAIAFESLVKVVALLAVGIFVCFFLFDSPMVIWQQSRANISLSEQLNFSSISSVAAMTVIAMAGFLSLPRQFQVMVVELKDSQDTWLSRRVFPLYILVFAVFAVPLGLAGKLLLEGQVPADTYVLFLPSVAGQSWLTLLAFLGAISAASSMVIISSIALSTMLSNEIIFPLLFKRQRSQQHEYDSFRVRLLNIRKALVLFVIMLGYGVFLFISQDTLASIGEVAFGAIAQLTPALIAAFYWRRASLTGVYGGIFIGFSLWLATNFLPQFGLYQHPFTSGILPANTMATLVSLGANILVMWMLSQVSRQSVQERVQASIFLEWQQPDLQAGQHKRSINPQELELLVSRFVGDKKAQKSFAEFQQQHAGQNTSTGGYNQALIQHTEQVLAGVMGVSSARLVLSSAIQGRDMALDELAVLVEEASTQKQAFSQSLLQSAIENASEGISIIDGELNLVAWNGKYLDLFDYPEELVYLGAPVEDLIRFNVNRGLCGVGDIEQQVSKRLNYLRQGSAHSSERQHANGQVIRIQGNPLPDGGFVMLFSDITAYRQAEQVLKAENIDLEALVTERTEKLAQTNRELELARERAEQAHVNKSQYLKACSHDLMQPLEAARLFASALSEQNQLNATQQRQVANINHSLKLASDLLGDLSEIARIESGNIKPQHQAVRLADVFASLAQEFSASADDLDVDFRTVATDTWVHTDQHLLHRILQNLLGNAFRYASPGRVVLGVRRAGNELIIQVIDNGPGIPKDKQSLVFEQFTQLPSNVNQQGATQQAKGLGLGLNITRSLSQLLGHQLSLSSEQGKGCNFSVRLERIAPVVQAPVRAVPSQTAFAGVTVLCIDNDADVLNGMVELLVTWQCNVLAASSIAAAQSYYDSHSDSIDLIIADYQLDEPETGLDLIASLREQSSYYLPAILVTATTEHDIEQKAQQADVGFMRKLVKPAGLRALISAMLTKKLQANYSG
ncbi:PAS-domain containing protein [Endozoicomonas sp. G2_1]|uniref:hybrid sensor histidine kinase/response regulator n=1 Tax=Endozoicomonas sp. G2_1 TaxID=2821091 RepID=UPI001ADB5537|nr:PAS-domain containing protein [Endozoicomonas sp. G2_1]MBO9490332.1 PAS-domain containing protein [Endozoicomonas sp. G2_1]